MTLTGTRREEGIQWGAGRSRPQVLADRGACTVCRHSSVPENLNY
jgi:hypothetical protein